MTVHVFGAPDDMTLRSDERTCDQDDGLEPVVYHLGAVKLSSGDWACTVCGCTTVPKTNNQKRICGIQ